MRKGMAPTQKKLLKVLAIRHFPAIRRHAGSAVQNWGQYCMKAPIWTDCALKTQKYPGQKVDSQNDLIFINGIKSMARPQFVYVMKGLS